ncbi:unnamed protein product [Leptidea sinapis]|uniref:Uncharacterized protein n=1 Tax=Leptidea sinapis TaxID=189913 RepID=A0A5E4QDP6_9NEOP|nr:unnamed protein product [Leptidea sinapis]
MLSKIVFLFVVFELGVGNAVPIWRNDPYNSGVFLRNAAVPSVAYGYGSGFSSNIGGIHQSSGFGSSYQSGAGEAYGMGIGSSDGSAQGISYTNTAPHYAVNHVPVYQHVAPNNHISTVPKHQQATPNYQIISVPNQHRPSGAHQHGDFVDSVSSVQSQKGGANHQANIPNHHQASMINTGHGLYPQTHGNFGSSVSSVQSPNAGSIVGATNSNSDHQSALSSVQDPIGHGSSFAATNSYQPFGRNGPHFEKAITSVQNIGGYKINDAETIQSHRDLLQKTGATHIEAPGIQVSQAQAINAGYY